MCLHSNRKLYVLLVSIRTNVLMMLILTSCCKRYLHVPVMTFDTCCTEFDNCISTLQWIFFLEMVAVEKLTTLPHNKV
jgi:hypothetical protein